MSLLLLFGGAGANASGITALPGRVAPVELAGTSHPASLQGLTAPKELAGDS